MKIRGNLAVEDGEDEGETRETTKQIINALRGI